MKTERVTSVAASRRGARVGDKKLSEPVTLFAAIEAEQHQALREIAFSERRSLADVVREALTGFIAHHMASPRETASDPPARRRRQDGRASRRS